MSKFKHGDKVLCTGKADENSDTKNNTGIVVCDAETPWVKVAFDKKVSGGWWSEGYKNVWACPVEMLRPLIMENV